MSSSDSWLEPLRAYPRELVLACAVLALAGGLWVLAKVAKWVLYGALLAVFIVVAVGIARWLWE